MSGPPSPPLSEAASPEPPAQILTTRELADPPPPYPAPRRPRRRRREGQASTHSAVSGDEPGEETPLLGPGPGMTRTMSGGTLASALSDDALPFVYAEEDVGAWRRYWRPLGDGVCWRALVHLLLLNFPYALCAWVYLFVFTVAGTALLITLPLGAVLCFFNLLGARALARGELALQSRFHGPLAVEPYPSHPIFTRQRVPSTDDGEAQPAPGAEPSFYRNTYAMCADATTYRALFYFLVIKPGLTLLLTLGALVGAPVCAALVLPLPALLRAARTVGAWQAGVAVEGLYLPV